MPDLHVTEGKKLIQQILDYARETYQTEPEYLWVRMPEAAVLRNAENDKWYAVMMKISKDKLGMKGKELVWILDLKCEPMLIGSLLEMDGYLPAYHMNKMHWIGVLMDGTVRKEQILELLDLSYHLTEGRKT